MQQRNVTLETGAQCVNVSRIVVVLELRHVERQRLGHVPELEHVQRHVDEMQRQRCAVEKVRRRRQRETDDALERLRESRRSEHARRIARTLDRATKATNQIAVRRLQSIT